MRKILLVGFISVLWGVPALAQQQAQQQPQQPAQQQQQTATDPAEPDQQVFVPPPARQPATAQKNGQSQPNQPQSGASPNASPNGSASGSGIGTNDRLFFVLPNYGTLENAGQVKPLTVKQKFDIQLRNCFDPVVYPYVGLLAGISQAWDSDPGYGQGALGYAKRYGAAFLDSADENFMVGAVFPSLLKQDPRYYQMGKGGFVRRSGYSLSRLFVTRSDAGNTEFNFSELLGSAAGAGIGTTYRTDNQKSAGDIVSDWWTQMGWDAVSNLMKEFWPDIHHKFHRNNS